VLTLLQFSFEILQHMAQKQKAQGGLNIGLQFSFEIFLVSQGAVVHQWLLTPFNSPLGSSLEQYAIQVRALPGGPSILLWDPLSGNDVLNVINALNLQFSFEIFNG